MPRTALFAGSFDPVTNGHLDIIERTARHFDDVIVAVIRNPQKAQSLFTLEERQQMLAEVTSHLSNVSIDFFTGLLVEFAKEHFPEFTAPVLADERFELVIDDGMNYVAATDRRFDVIIVDSTDPLGPGKILFSEEFYSACRRRMNKGAVMVTQNGVPILQTDELTEGISKFRRLFADGNCYVAAIPTYVGGHMAMGWATDNVKLRQASVKTIAARYKKAGRFPTKYWTPEVHVAAFALPRFIADKVAKASKR